MAFIIKDRVKEATTSTGTGAVSLGGAAATFDTFQSYMTNGDTTYYAIVHTTSGTDEWEVGLGTWNTGNTLTRTTVLAGSNGTSAVNFSAGTKDVFMTYPASKAAVAGEDVTFADITVTGTVDGRDVAADGTKLDGIDTSADVTDATTVAAAGALMKSGGTMTGNLILNADPTTALGAATKEYVDTIAAAGIHYHTPVRVETPSALTASYDNGTSGVGATLTNSGTQAALVIDGVTVATSDRVLVYNQTNAAHNGIYTVTNTGSASTNWVLTRATDADSYGVSDPDAFGEGDAFFVKEGDTGAGELYVMNTSGTITFGTTAINFTVIAETAVYSAGTGITLDGTTFSIGQDVGTTANVTFNQVTAAIIGNVTGNLTGDVTGNADTATALETARTIQLSGDVTGSATFDGSANINITAAVQDDSHAHVISNVDGLQTALDGKVPTTRTITAGNGLTGGGDLSANRTLNVGAGSGISVTADAVAHADTSTQASVNNSGNTFIQDVTLDGFGHVTGLTSGSVSVGDAVITIAAGGGLQTGGDFTTNQSINETITLAHADTSSQASVNNSNGTVIQDITLDGYGHITGLASANLDDRYYTESEADSRFMRNQVTYSDAYSSDNDNINGIAFLRITGGSNAAFGGHHNLLQIPNSGSSQYDVQLAFETDADPQFKFRAGYGGSGNNWSAWRQVFHDAYHPNADKWTTARTLSLSGDASGSVSWDGSANATLSVAVSNDSHTHDGRYYTETEADSRFVNASGDTMTGTLTLTGSSGASRLRIEGTTPTMDFDDSDGDSFFIHVNSNNFYVLADRDGGGNYNNWETPHPLQLEADTNIGYLFGHRMFAENYHPNADKWTTARTLSLSGDASGSVSWDGSGNATLSVTVANDSHTHDGRYYTESEADSRFVNVTGDTMTGTLNLTTNSDVYRIGADNYDTSMTGLTVRPSDGVNPSAGQALFMVRSGGGSPRFFAQHDGRTGTSNSDIYVNTNTDMSGGNKVWHQGNDGSGSGLDADKLDGLHESSFMRRSANSNLDMNNYNIVDVEDIELQDRIYHEGDTDTYMQFNAANSWRVVTGNTEGLKVSGSNVDVPDAIRHTGDTNTYMQFHAADQWRVVTGGGERLEVNNTNTTVQNILNLNSTSHFLMPRGTTAQRPSSPVAGMQRYNSTTSQIEFYDGTAWFGFDSKYNIEILCVGGGGGGGGGDVATGGSGGSGAAVTMAYEVSPSTSLSISIGGGGAGGPGNGNNLPGGAGGSNGGGAGGRSGTSGTSGAGGGGGGYTRVRNGSTDLVVAGGGGGGGGANEGNQNEQAAGGGGNQPRGNQGTNNYNGGTGFNYSGDGGGGGGGGGGRWGGTGQAQGVAAGASGGGNYGSNSPTIVNGPNGASNSSSTTAAATVSDASSWGYSNNKGRGGAGTNSGTGGGGGIGICVIRYLGPQRGSGGTVTSSGGYTLHTFTGNGTYTA